MTEILHKQLSFAVVGAAMEVHRVLGSGFLEAVYQTASRKGIIIARNSISTSGRIACNVQR